MENMSKSKPTKKSVKQTAIAKLVIVQFDDDSQVSRVIPDSSSQSDVTAAINAMIENADNPQGENEAEAEDKEI